MELSLARMVAHRASISRRLAAEYISEDRVEVDGVICSSIAEKVSEDSLIKLNGELLIAAAKVKRQVLLYHKPVGEVCSSVAHGKPHVFGALPELDDGKWIMVGRLDINTSGLLLFTTDGELAHRLMHPKYKLDREYLARVKGRPQHNFDAASMAMIKRGAKLDGKQASFKDIMPLHRNSKSSNRYFYLVVQEGRNRLVRRLWEHFGYSVSRLSRVRFANISMPEELEAGDYVMLKKQDVRNLVACVDL
ncbi:MAG: pseudouridine synthase [Gammaproteobacteria bacterium]|nr:pseudouridine synthase [Gammaproteobacteria bacterium]